MKSEEWRVESEEPTRNAAGYESQKPAEKRLCGVGDRGGHGGPPVQGSSLLAGGASFVMTDSAEFLESEEHLLTWLTLDFLTISRFNPRAFFAPFLRLAGRAFTIATRELSRPGPTANFDTQAQ